MNSQCITTLDPKGLRGTEAGRRLGVANQNFSLKDPHYGDLFLFTNSGQASTKVKLRLAIPRHPHSGDARTVEFHRY